MKRFLSVLAVILIALLLAAASGGAPSKKGSERFVPSEEVPADSAVAFPVDI